jgi:hypothetical protein
MSFVQWVLVNEFWRVCVNEFWSFGQLVVVNECWSMSFGVLEFWSKSFGQCVLVNGCWSMSFGEFWSMSVGRQTLYVTIANVRQQLNKEQNMAI